MATLSLSELTETLIAQPGARFQLKAGVKPSLIEGKRGLEWGASVPSNIELEALAKVLVAGSVTPARKNEDGFVMGVFQRSDQQQFEYRILRGPEGVKIALRLAPMEEIIFEEAPPAPGKVASPEQQRTPRSVLDLDITSIRTLLRDVVGLKGSDLIITSTGNSSVRHGSELLPIPNTGFTENDILESLGDRMDHEAKQTLSEEGSVDLALEVPGLIQEGVPQRFRVNVFHHIHGMAAAFRPIWDEIPDFGTLGLPDAVADIGHFPYGLVLLTGPTGAGKSTTLCSILERINVRRHCHIITLEDPIEFVFSRKKALVHQREIGTHVASFAGGLRAALRENPDIILVGEMRDKETISAAITAAETGHLVLSTLHCGNAAQALDRIIDIFPEHQQAQVRVQLSDCLRAVVTQKLLPRIGSTTRVPAVEILRVNPAVANLIRERKLHMLTSQMQTGKEEGMIPFDDSLLRLVKERVIAKETALGAATDRKTLQGKLE